MAFAPVAGRTAKVLVLGTLPSQESLKRGEYYGHPRNAFWPIIEALFGIPATLAYPQRARKLAKEGLALWNVCATAERPGSLDSSIRRGSEVINDFSKFRRAHPELAAICFNGGKAAELFRRHVELDAPMRYHDLPSTSAAHASMPFARKVELWSVIRKEARDEAPAR